MQQQAERAEDPGTPEKKIAGARGVGRVAILGLLLGPALFGLVLLLPTPDGLSPEAHRLGAATAWMAAWWMTEALPVAATALLPLALFPILGISDPKPTAAAYGHDLIWLFFGGFQLAFAVERCGLHRRMALFLVRLVGTRADRLVLGFMLASGLLSMWLLNTSTTLMMLPVGMAVASAIETDGPGNFGKALMLGIAYAASVGGMGTYVGTAPNGVFAGVSAELGVQVGFADWMIFAAPLSVALIFGIWLYLTRWAFPVARTTLPAEHPAQKTLKEDMGPWTQAQRITALIFGLTVAAWVSRRFILSALDMGPKSVTDATIAVLAALLLYVVPAAEAEGTRRRPLLAWADTARTPWHILILFGGGFALAGGFSSTGLSIWMGELLAVLVEGLPLGLVILSVVLLVTFLTEVTSNTATATVLLPVIGGLAIAMELPAQMLMIPATLACSCAFMLPVATPPNAIVYASGLFRLTDMSRAGFWLNLGTAGAITVWMLTWGAWTL